MIEKKRFNKPLLQTFMRILPVACLCLSGCTPDPRSGDIPNQGSGLTQPTAFVFENMSNNQESGNKGQGVAATGAASDIYDEVPSATLPTEAMELLNKSLATHFHRTKKGFYACLPAASQAWNFEIAGTGNFVEENLFINRDSRIVFSNLEPVAMPANIGPAEMLDGISEQYHVTFRADAALLIKFVWGGTYGQSPEPIKYKSETYWRNVTAPLVWPRCRLYKKNDGTWRAVWVDPWRLDNEMIDRKVNWGPFE